MTEISVTMVGADAVKKRLFALANSFPDACRDALYEEMRTVEYASLKVTPMRTGNLRGSRFIRYPAERGGTIEGEMGYTANYAAAVHEMGGGNQISAGGRVFARGIHWSQPGTGPKYLENPARAHAPKMIPNMVKRMQAWLRSGEGMSGQSGGRFV